MFSINVAIFDKDGNKLSQTQAINKSDKETIIK